MQLGCYWLSADGALDSFAGVVGVMGRIYHVVGN